ncbi:hypothetical protein ACWE42_12365 [Sutcliffiella cohnii]
MGKSKLYLILILTFTMLVGLTGKVSAMENSDEFITIEKYEEITDIELLYEKAKENGPKNLNLNKLQDSKYSSISNINSYESTNLEKETYEYEQLLEVQQNSRGETIEHYALTKFEDVYLIDDSVMDNDDSFTILSSGSKNRSGTDSTIGVRAYTTIYYSFVTNTVEHIRLTKVEGGWTILDPSLTLSGREVLYGAVGWSRYGNTSGQRATRNPIGNTFSYTPSSSWHPVALGSDMTFVGVNTKVTISKRVGTSPSWTLSIQNNY